MANADFGVRQFINLLVVALRYYNRHKARIDPNLAPSVLDALELLGPLVEIIAAHNVPGRDPFVADNLGGDGL